MVSRKYALPCRTVEEAIPCIEALENDQLSMVRTKSLGSNLHELRSLVFKVTALIAC